MWDFLECFSPKGLLGRGNYKNNTKKYLMGTHVLNWFRLWLWASSLLHKALRCLILCHINNLFISKHIYLRRRSSRFITDLLSWLAQERAGSVSPCPTSCSWEGLTAPSCSAAGPGLLMLMWARQAQSTGAEELCGSWSLAQSVWHQREHFGHKVKAADCE